MVLEQNSSRLKADVPKTGRPGPSERPVGHADHDRGGRATAKRLLRLSEQDCETGQITGLRPRSQSRLGRRKVIKRFFLALEPGG